MPEIVVTRTYLQMTAPDALRPARATDPRLRLDRVDPCPAHFYRYLYGETGRAYHWVDRLAWSDERLAGHLASPGTAIWVLLRGGAPAGFFELARHDDGSVEIAYFGLLPGFLGQGLGKHLLTTAVEQAWRFGGATGEQARRVWLHTCTLDDAAALPNYLSRGFAAYREERYTVERDEGSAGA